MNNTPPFDNDYEKRVQQAYASIGIKQPARMAAGGVVEDTGGMLSAAARGIKPKLSAEDEAYFNAHNQYATDFTAYSDAYNKWADDWNAGRTEAAYSGIAEPTAPTVPTAQGDLDINAYQAQLAAAAQNKAASRVGGIRAFANPEAYNLAGHAGVSSFENGGEAVAAQDPRAMDLEQFLLDNSRTQVGPVDVQEVRSSKGPGKYDTRISRNEDGFQAFADVDVGDKKVSQLGARYAGRGRIGNYEVQYVLDPETKQPVITGAIRKELSPTSDVSAEGVYVPQKDGKDYYNAGVRYTKRFEDGGEVTAADIERVNKESYLSPNGVAPEMGEVKPKYPALNAWSKGLEMAAAPFDKYALDKRIPLVGGMTAADFMGINDTASLARDVSYGDPVVRGKSLQTSKIDPRLLAVADIVPVAGAAAKGATTLAKAGAKEVARQVETGTGVIGRNTMDPRMYAAEFYSPAARAVESHKMDKMPASQWMAWLSSNAPKAAKEELAQTEAGRWLKEQEGNISKQDLLAVINESSPDVIAREKKTPILEPGVEVEGWIPDWAKFGQYNLKDGNNNYRELILSLPAKEGKRKYAIPQKHAYGDPIADTNRVAHIRMNDRVDAKGNKVLFVEEIQSDWAQTGRKEGFSENDWHEDRRAQIKDELESLYTEAAVKAEQGESTVDVRRRINTLQDHLDELLPERVPSGPYVGDTKAWTGLALKKIIEDAVDKGYSSVAFTTGKQQNARYGLSKKVNEFRVSPLMNDKNTGVYKTPQGEDVYMLSGYLGKENTYNKQLTEGQIRKLLGDENTNKLFASKPTPSPIIPAIKTKVLKNVNMELGGSGMKGFYDEILPQSTKDVLKQLGINPQIKQIDLTTKEPLLKRVFSSDKTPVDEKAGVQWGFDITPELIKAVKEKGISKFKHGGEVTDFIKSKK